MTESNGAEKPHEGEKIAEFCLVHRKKIVSKLYQIQIKAINHALQNLNIESSSAEQLPAKVIEFIKKWVAKEKVLISHCVKALLPQNFDKIITVSNTVTSDNILTIAGATSNSTIKIEESSVYLTKDLAAKKNR
mgnify:FL=1